MVIQRIQSLYIILSVIATVITMFSPIGCFVEYGGKNIYQFTPLHVTLNGINDYSVAGLFAILGLSAIVGIVSLLCFKNLVLQIRLLIFNIILVVGYYMTFFALWWIVGRDLDSTLKVNWPLCLPIISIILMVMALRAIGKDKKLLRDANSMRLRD